MQNRVADSEKPLTKRQTQILRLTCTGLGHQQIADALGLSLYTVHAHIATTMKRLGIETTCRVGPACYLLGRSDGAGLDWP